MNEDQIKLFMKQLELDSSWRLQTHAVKGFEKARSLISMKRATSLNYILSHPSAIDQILPKGSDGKAVEKLFSEEERSIEDHQACFIFRDLWLFPSIEESEQSQFESSMDRYKAWLDHKASIHFKVGYPNRHAEQADELRLEEESIEKKALAARQAEHTHDRMAALMADSYTTIKTDIEQERQDDIIRAKLRIEQMAFEDEVKSKIL